jgi:hypothetical protein
VLDINLAGGTGTDAVTIDPALNSPDLRVTLVANAGNTVLLPGATTRLFLPNIGAGGTVRTDNAGDDVVLITKDLSIADTGTLDLVDDDLMYEYGRDRNSPDATVRDLLAAGYNGGPWNGDGISSTAAAAAAPGTYALGWADDDESSTILVKYTYGGDANLDGQVDITDLGILGTNWQGTGMVWEQADFTYDRIVDITDLGILATNWLAGVGAPLFAGGPDPEQTFLGGIEKLELSEDDVSKLLEMLNDEWLPAL